MKNKLPLPELDKEIVDQDLRESIQRATVNIIFNEYTKLTRGQDPLSEPLRLG